MPRRKVEPEELEHQLPTEDEPRFVTPKQLDTITGREIANVHLKRIFLEGGDAGEQELVLQLLHLLHARKYSLNPDDVTTRYSDFNEQLAAVFGG